MLFEYIEMDGQERTTMQYRIREASKDTCQLRVVGGPECTHADEVKVDLQEEREAMEIQRGIEDYWAGRNLAGRNSAQWAA